MADVTSIIEAGGTGIGGTAILFGALWKPVVRRHDRTRAMSLFLAGTPAAPGMAAVLPAGDRLVGVEVGLLGANRKLDEVVETANSHTAALAGLAAAMESLAQEVAKITHQTETNQGGSMHDTIDVIAAEQERVAIEKSST